MLKFYAADLSVDTSVHPNIEFIALNVTDRENIQKFINEIAKKEILIFWLIMPELQPIAAEINEEERFPQETVEKMAKIGLFGIQVSQEWGEAGGDN